MTNAEKYKTAEERVEAFGKFCAATKLKKQCEDALSCTECQFAWLDMEAEEEKPLPCPSCGNKSVFIVHDKSSPMPWSVKCSCGYSSERTPDKELTIATHNRVARAVMDAGKKEVTP